MTNLVGLEISRALSRRLVRVMFALAVLAIAITGLVVFAKSGATADPDTFYNDKRFHLVEVQDALMGTSSILFIGILIGASSFIGAEWRFGTMAGLLTWEPRRVRVLLAKAVAAVLVATAVALILQALLAASLLPAAYLRGTTEGVDADWVRETLGLCLRITALTVVTTLVGVALATVGRNSAAVLGVGFLYFGVLEGLIRGLRPGWQQWLLGDNTATFLIGGLETPPLSNRSTLEAGLYLAVCTVALMAAATLWFKQRDLT